MMGLLLAILVLAALLCGLGIVLFIVLPVKWAILAAIVCLVLAGGVISLAGGIRFI